MDMENYILKIKIFQKGFSFKVDVKEKEDSLRLMGVIIKEI